MVCVAILGLCMSQAEAGWDSKWVSAGTGGAASDWYDANNWAPIEGNSLPHPPSVSQRGVLNTLSGAVAPLDKVVNIDGGIAFVFELWVGGNGAPPHLPISIGGSMTLNILNDATLFVGTNRPPNAAAMFVGQTTITDTTINIDSSTLFLGKSFGVPHKTQIHAFAGDSQWNLTNGASLVASVFRSDGNTDVDISISGGSVLDLEDLRFSNSPNKSIDIVGTGSQLIVRFDLSPFGNRLTDIQNWISSDTIVAEGGAGTVLISPLDGIDMANGVVLTSALEGDFDVDGDVDGNDFLLWQRDISVGSLSNWETNFGVTTGAAFTSAVPEPSTMVLACLSLVGFSVRRRRSR